MNNDTELYWTAFYTKPRNEKKAADRLISQGFEMYCPTRTVLKQWSDRKKKVIEPVFTSYIFAKVNEEMRLNILKDPGVVSNVRWLGQPAVVKEYEINEIRSFLEDFPKAETFSSHYDKGDKVDVESGIFSGQTGTLRRVKGNKAILTINSLGLEIRAEVNLNHLKKVS